MKTKLLILMLVIPSLVFAQQVTRLDSLVVEGDTTIAYRITSSNQIASWYVYADSLQGTLDGTVEVVVCNDMVARGRTQPADSLFDLLSANMTKTLSANGPYIFYDQDGLPFEWYGLRFTQNNITKWHMKWEIVYQSK